MKYSLLSVLPSVFILLSCSPHLGGIDEPLTEKNLCDLNRRVVSQQFDFDKKGNLYYVELFYSHHQHLVNIWRVGKNKINRNRELTTFKGDSMTVVFAGHPTGFAIEDTPDGPYVWISNYASKLDNNQYWLSQTISRMKYIPGAVRMPDEKEIEHFWFPHRSDINVALDKGNDLLAFSFYYNYDDEERLHIDPNRNRMIRVYKLSEAMATPLEEITLPRKWYRGGDDEPLPYDSVVVRLKAHNLSHLTAVAEVGTHRGGLNPEKINSSAWQGFDVDKDIIWFSEGVTSTGTYLTGYGFDGNVVSHRTKVLSSDVCPEWDKFGVCDDAKKQYENEGVRVWKGDLYLGMFTKRQDTGYRSNVMRFKRKIFY